MHAQAHTHTHTHAHADTHTLSQNWQTWQCATSWRQTHTNSRGRRQHMPPQQVCTVRARHTQCKTHHHPLTLDPKCSTDQTLSPRVTHTHTHTHTLSPHPTPHGMNGDLFRNSKLVCERVSVCVCSNRGCFLVKCIGSETISFACEVWKKWGYKYSDTVSDTSWVGWVLNTAIYIYIYIYVYIYIYIYPHWLSTPRQTDRGIETETERKNIKHVKNTFRLGVCVCAHHACLHAKKERER